MRSAAFCWLARRHGQTNRRSLDTIRPMLVAGACLHGRDPDSEDSDRFDGVQVETSDIGLFEQFFESRYRPLSFNMRIIPRQIVSADIATAECSSWCARTFARFVRPDGCN